MLLNRVSSAASAALRFSFAFLLSCPEALFLCLLVIILAIIEYTGFVVPIIFHGCMTYYMIVETRDKINSRNPNVHQANPSAVVAGAVFAMLSKMAVAVLKVVLVPCRVRL